MHLNHSVMLDVIGYNNFSSFLCFIIEAKVLWIRLSSSWLETKWLPLQKIITTIYWTTRCDITSAGCFHRSVLLFILHFSVCHHSGGRSNFDADELKAMFDIALRLVCKITNWQFSYSARKVDTFNGNRNRKGREVRMCVFVCSWCMSELILTWSLVSSKYVII